MKFDNKIEQCKSSGTIVIKSGKFFLRDIWKQKENRT